MGCEVVDTDETTHDTWRLKQLFTSSTDLHTTDQSWNKGFLHFYRRFTFLRRRKYQRCFI
uniref:Uncharacterized protein n=1 Tax=Nothobranchius korthausae TaxID=1143690 RepID=A0A1A8GXX8_9TELE